MDTSPTNSQVALWDLAERKVTARLPGLLVAFSPDGKQLLLRKDSGGLQIRDIDSLKVDSEFTLEPNTNTDTLPKLSTDGSLLAFRGRRGGRYLGFGLRVYNSFRKAIYSLEGPVTGWVFSPDSRLIAFGDGDAINDSIAALVLKEIGGSVERRVPDCGAACLAFSPDGRLLAAGTFPPGINLVSVTTGTLLGKLRGHQTLVTAVAFTPDGKTLASGAQDRTIRLYNVETRRQVAVLQVSSEVLSLAFSPDGQTLVSSEAADKTGPGHYRFWQAPRTDAPPLPLPALRAPAPDSIWVTASKLKNTVQRAGANP